MYPKKFFQSAHLKPQKGMCFVIMPFEQRFDRVYEIIRDVVHGPELNFRCERADDLVQGGHILEDVLRGIAQAEIVIADLTRRNPNVFYELGIAHMVKDVEKIIMLSQAVEDIPFDLRPYRCIIYSQTVRGVKEFRTKLLEAITTVAGRGFQFTLQRDQPYTFPQRLFGRDRYMYDFEIPQCYFGHGGAKFHLKVRKHGFDGPPQSVFDGGFALKTGERRPLGKWGWELKLEAVDDLHAHFVLLPS
jgi:hypothetical protein